MNNSVSFPPCPWARGVSPEPCSLLDEQKALLSHTSPPTRREHMIRAENRRPLLLVEQVPPWAQDKYILSGYRSPTGSVADCFNSWTYLHNETGNIYTHMVPALCLVGGEILLYSCFKNSYPNATDADLFIFAMLLLAALTCMTFSTTYHTLMCHSYGLSDFWLHMDYIGIVGLIVGNIMCGTYMAFYCLPSVIWLHWGVVMLFPLFRTSLPTYFLGFVRLQYKPKVFDTC